ncbi:twin-arginine translocase subunit TatC [Propionimicrobium sp. PCR01-08-3]|uniref:twin-arginine translocase subunit TatC n=1 Tax=Propionimicrobium sp. PCR01-08-3 TaxID=3052086 RepID=UPI00255CACA7|nr:twin-arginine translocase subunit TatC [Propionimicrobium sp. PCR01-08-3]WIY81480.1 twin-arginine translocase subunit TatC [Propionimicrobium sp. PCR01-08-3]
MSADAPADSKPKSRFAWLKPPQFDENGAMSIWDHLREIRYRLIVSMVAIVVLFIAAFAFRVQIVELILYPYQLAAARVQAANPDATIQVINSGVTSPMMLALKSSGLAALIAACPVWLYQLWAFIVPGLLKKEKRVARLFLLSAIPLFLGGVAVGYSVLPKAFEFMLGFTVVQAGVANLQDLNDFLSLEMRMLLVFGISFLLPVVLVMLNMLGVLKSWQLKKARTISIFVCFVFGAVATPSGDPFSMLALSAPMVIMYLVSEFISARRDKTKLKQRIRAGEITPEEAEAEYRGKTLQTDE